MIRFLGVVVGLVARLWLATLRCTVIVHPELSAVSDRSWVLAFWHGQQFALLRWPRRRPLVALVSRSTDGELLAHALRVLDVTSERGSSSRGGVSALRGIARRLLRHHDAAFAVDGPRGPHRVARKSSASRSEIGATAAARLGRATVVPLAAACSSSWVFTRTWDKFEVPLPFSKVAIALGAPIDPAAPAASDIGAAIEYVRAIACRANCGTPPTVQIVQ